MQNEVARRLRPMLISMILLLSTLLVACGGGDAPGAESNDDVAGDAARGEGLYEQTAIGAASAPGCITCHSLEPDIVLAGPSHAGIGTRAATAVAGKSAEQYLTESITDPDAVVPEGFAAGVMYRNYGRDLSDQEIAHLVAFLLTLK
jgi:nitric oxide reductase subunit C